MVSFKQYSTAIICIVYGIIRDEQLLNRKLHVKSNWIHVYQHLNILCIIRNANYNCNCLCPPTGACTSCPKVLDLAFLLDSSGSVNHNDDNNWRSLLTFVSALVSELLIGPRHVQVGVVSFGNQARLDIRLDEFTNKNMLRHRIQELRYMTGHTYTAHGLQYLRERLFIEDNGDREAAENVAILIVDGPPDVRMSDTVPEAAALRADDTHLLAIGVGHFIDRHYLESLTGNVHAVVMVESYGMLVDYVNEVLGVVVDTLPAGTGQVPLPVPDEPGKYWNLMNTVSKSQCMCSLSCLLQFVWMLSFVRSS